MALKEYCVFKSPPPPFTLEELQVNVQRTVDGISHEINKCLITRLGVYTYVQYIGQTHRIVFFLFSDKHAFSAGCVSF